MRLRQMVATAGAVALIGPAAAMGDTLIGNFASGNVQATNSDQSAINGSGGAEFAGPGPVKFIDGSSKPHLVQDSTNLADHLGVIGGGGGGTLIGDAAQENAQAIDSRQSAKKGTQISTNLETGTQIIGLAAGDAVIGSPTQVSRQAENSLQTAAGRPGAVTTVILGPVNKAPLTETSTNIADSCQLLIGGC